MSQQPDGSQAAGADDKASLEVHSAASNAAQVGDIDIGDTAASIVPGADDRPTDEQILSYENQIREAQRQRPLLGEREPVANLLPDYQDSGTVFAPKIRGLVQQFSEFRRTRQDGNCFYRSFLFGLLERLVVERNARAAQKLVHVVTEWREKMKSVGFQELVFEDAQELLLEYLKEASDTSAPVSVRELALRLSDETVANTIIMFVRLVTSAEVQRRQEFFTPFILGMTDNFIDIEDFCRRNIECMGEESDHIQLVAVADAFQVPIKVLYLDNSGQPPSDGAGTLPCDMHEFKPNEEDATEPELPQVTVLYRPGHYDILYTE